MLAWGVVPVWLQGVWRGCSLLVHGGSNGRNLGACTSSPRSCPRLEAYGCVWDYRAAGPNLGRRLEV